MRKAVCLGAWCGAKAWPCSAPLVRPGRAAEARVMLPDRAQLVAAAMAESVPDGAGPGPVVIGAEAAGAGGTAAMAAGAGHWRGQAARAGPADRRSPVAWLTAGAGSRA